MSIESVPSQKSQANGEYAQRINRVIDYLRGQSQRAMGTQGKMSVPPNSRWSQLLLALSVPLARFKNSF